VKTDTDCFSEIWVSKIQLHRHHYVTDYFLTEGLLHITLHQHDLQLAKPRFVNHVLN